MSSDQTGDAELEYVVEVAVSDRIVQLERELIVVRRELEASRVECSRLIDRIHQLSD